MLTNVRKSMVAVITAALAVSMAATACSSTPTTTAGPSTSAGSVSTGSSSSGQSSAGSGGSTSAAAGGSPVTLKIVYLSGPTDHTLTDLFTSAKTMYEKAHPGSTVQLEPINASEADFYTKIALMERSSSTAPDLVYEDSFQVNADAAAGYLVPLDNDVKSWADWSQYGTAIRAQGTALDGKLYGLPLTTDTQGIWYNKKVFAKAGLPTTWQPKTLADILTAAQAIKKVSGVVPMNIYSTKAGGEATTLRGVENLLTATPGALEATLYNSKTGKWVTGSKGMTDALTFIHTAYADGLLPSVSDMENPNLPNVLQQTKFPAGHVGMLIDGSWLSGAWDKGGSNPWPTWTTDAGWAAIPTKDGAAPGMTSMSGGWTMAISSKSAHPAQAWDLLTMVNTKQNNLAYVLASSGIPVRKDVTTDPAYIKSSPAASFFAKLVSVTHFRPSLTAYPQVSNLIQAAAESTTVGGSDPASAASAYDKALARVVGASNVGSGSSS